MNVQGAVAIVTGGASGLGLASARRLAAAWLPPPWPAPSRPRKASAACAS
jgi:hypothetical protein